MGEREDYEDAHNLNDKITEIKKLAPKANAGDSEAKQEIASLSLESGDIYSRWGDHENAYKAYNEGFRELGELKGRDYDETRDEREILKIKVAREGAALSVITAKKRGKVGKLEEHTVGAGMVYAGEGSSRYRSHAMALIMALFAGSIVLMSLTATGNVIGYTAQKYSSLLGIILFAVCIAALYVLLLGKKN
jgi:hypothetical protein